MKIGLYTDFSQKLKKLFGKFDEDHKRFEKASNSEIARELGYSDAQFSRLINESATDGEYQRAIQNVERILLVIRLEQELANHGGTNTSWKQPKWLLVSVVIGLVFIGLFYFVNHISQNEITEDRTPRDEMLKWSFETSFINPYLKLDDLPEDCNYPCYKYQGKWALQKGYKIPFFRERNGFHYLATEVNMYARCMNEKSNAGDVIEGFEYQKHEIWYDKRELPLDSFTMANNTLKAFYQAMDFSKIEFFVKVATVHTFFRNEFQILDTAIHRNGKVIGRDLEFASREVLNEIFQDQNIIHEIENELSRIASNRLEDFSRPIACKSALLPNADFHQIKDGDLMSFDCQLTTSRVSFDYNKTYVLLDQYIKNSCRF